MQSLPKSWKDPLTPLPKDWRPKFAPIPKKKESTSKTGVLFSKSLAPLPDKKKSVHHNGNTVREMDNEVIEKVYDRDEWSCILCNSNNLDRPHHAWYGLEANRWDDRNEHHQLVTLCIWCHYDIHSKWDTTKRDRCKDYLRDLYNHKY